MRLPLILSLVALPTVAHAQLFEDVTSTFIGETGQWSNKVELADIDGDGRVDILFANGGNYNEPSAVLEPNRIFLNRAASGRFKEATGLLGDPDLARVIKAQDVNGDGIVDIFVGAVYESQSRLYLGEGDGEFTEVTATHLPQLRASVGDIEFGDVDGDGDLDIALADWGPGDPFESAGGRVMLWLGDGEGRFVDATDARMPRTRVRWSWDMELIDVDNDYDLDMVVSCKVCTGGALYTNVGGNFVDTSDLLPQFTNNYEFEFADFNGDGFLDLVTINDGEQIGINKFNRPEHIFLGNGRGFVDATEQLWPDSQNLGFDDNAIVVLDFDSDGDPDFLIGSLDGPDRLMINDGTGGLTVKTNVFGGERTPGTLGIAVADLDGDGRLDCVQSQGELADDERVYLGTGIARDDAPPIVSHVGTASTGSGAVIRARIHDNKSPVKAHDFQSVTMKFRVGNGKNQFLPMQWYGEQLWRAPITAFGNSKIRYTLCAVDAAGNETCTEQAGFRLQDADDKADGEGTRVHESGGCSTGGGSSPLGLLLFGLAVAGLRRRKL